MLGFRACAPIWKRNLILLKELLHFRYTPNRFLAFVLVLVGVPANIGYHYYERNLGFWSDPFLRYGCAALLLGIPVCFRYAKSSIFKLFYWESTLLIFFPMASTYLMLMNSTNKYWYSTYILGMLFLGFCTKYYLIPFHFIFGAGLATFFHQRIHHFPAVVYSDALQAQIASVLACIVGNGVIIVLEYAHAKAKQATEEKLRAETEQLRAETAERGQRALQASNEILRTYTRASLADLILKGEDPRNIIPEEKELAILFADIRDFTGTTEKLNAYERLSWLNSYFTMGTRCVNAAGGEVDKYMGDSLMAIFESPKAAVEATISFRKEFQRYNQTMISRKDERFLIRSGAGIALGTVTRGNIGSGQKMDLTVVGSAVNIASRIESLTKVYNVDVLVTEDVIGSLGPGFPHTRWIDNVQVKGSKSHLKIYEVYGHQSEAVRAYKDATRDILEKALTIYFGKGFNDAERLFRALQSKAPPHTYLPDEPMDRICQYFIGRCAKLKEDQSLFEYYLRHWDGVHVFNEK
jgi:class 3 adenylate cyclase